MDILKDIRQQAKSRLRTVILPEATERRVLAAVKVVLKEKLAKLILLGEEKDILESLKKENIPLDQLTIIDIKKDKGFSQYAQTFYELRKHKGVTLEEAQKAIQEHPLFYAALMARQGRADAFVAGAAHTTADVVRAGIYCIGVDPAIQTVSSAFLMIVPNKQFGEEGMLFFADCGVVSDPSPKQLANIAIATAQTLKVLTHFTPRLAMLSYSTKGSAAGPLVEKVAQAARMVKEARPDLIIDGELQADSALVPEVSKIKCPDSVIQGNANILIFPNLDCGNIAYKIVQRLANARAVGPILQGLLKPCSDLSRGCSPEDIVDAICIACARAQAVKNPQPSA
jgi:phosphate acetyltransferase